MTICRFLRTNGKVLFLVFNLVLLIPLFLSASAPRCVSLFLNESQIVIQNVLRTAAELRNTKSFTSPRAWRRKTAKFGLPALDLPQEYGGRNFTAAQMVEVFEKAGVLDLDLRDVVGGAHVRPLIQSQEPEVQDIIRKVAQGNGYMAISITEADAGSNMRAMKSKSEKVRDGYLISGSKMYNGRFKSATHVIVFTQAANQNGGSGKLNAFVLPIDYPGLNFFELQAHGLKGNSFGGVSFDKLFIPEKYLLGGEGKGGKIFRSHFLYWRLMMSAAAIGTGKGALDQVAARLRERQAFGGPIGRFTHLQQPLAEHTAKLHMATLLVRQAAALIDQGQYEQAVPLVAMAKAEGVEFALAAADFAMKTFGAEGYTENVDLGKRVTDLMGLRIADGTTDVLRSEVVRKVYGDDLWDMAIGVSEP